MSAARKLEGTHRDVCACSSDCLFSTQHCIALGHISGSASLGLLLQLEYPRLERVSVLPGMWSSIMGSFLQLPAIVSVRQHSGGRVSLLCHFNLGGETTLINVGGKDSMIPYVCSLGHKPA